MHSQNISSIVHLNNFKLKSKRGDKQSVTSPPPQTDIHISTVGNEIKFGVSSVCPMALLEKKHLWFQNHGIQEVEALAALGLHYHPWWMTLCYNYPELLPLYFTDCECRKIHERGASTQGQICGEKTWRPHCSKSKMEHTGGKILVGLLW